MVRYLVIALAVALSLGGGTKPSAQSGALVWHPCSL